MGRSHVVLLAAALLVLGCPPEDKKKKATEAQPKDVCTRFGQSCEFSPGKLGTCVTKEGCVEPSPACFVCQSQH